MKLRLLSTGTSCGRNRLPFTLSFRRGAQLLSLAIFLGLLAGAGSEALESTDLFLRMDPLLSGISAIAARSAGLVFIPALLVLGSCLLAGRLFCGYICPLGTTLDAVPGPVSTRGAGPLRDKRRLRQVKYRILAFLLGASLFGVSYVFAACPLSLITRFYGLMVFPAAKLLSRGALTWLRPLAERFDLGTLAYAQIPTPRFATQVFILLFFATVFALARLSPRFWCRYLCPSGALMALFSFRPLIGRRVSAACSACGKCVRSCPMAAIPEKDPRGHLSGECLVCRQCEAVCPEAAISFTAKRPLKVGEPLEDFPAPSPRRQFLRYAAAGAATAIVNLTDLRAPYGEAGAGRVLPAALLRPPGALPEKTFLSRCVRCGQCMAACPTNTLQPLWLSAGIMGLFSPALTPRRGFCDPACNRCGTVCPTGAVRALPKEERLWAKTGTAVIFQRSCLAWAQHKSCVVCDEVCPFNAIALQREPGVPVALPHVIADRCSGCGFCEHFCPVQNQAAIVVTPMGALRLESGSFIREGKARGLVLHPRARGKGEQPPPGAAPGGAPGFDEGR
jgi:ferredoxin